METRRVAHRQVAGSCRVIEIIPGDEIDEIVFRELMQVVTN